MAVLASSRYSRWPLLLLTVVIANVSAGVVYNSKLLFALGFVPGNVVEVALGAWLLQRGNLWRTFDRDFAAFARALRAGALLPELAGATFGALSLHWHGFSTFPVAWVDWYVGSVIGANVAMPVALALRNTSASQALEAIICAPAIAVATGDMPAPGKPDARRAPCRE